MEMQDNPTLRPQVTDRAQSVNESLGEKLSSYFGQSINSFFHISLKNGYLFVQNPKVASSTLKSKLIETEIEGTNINRAEIGLHPDVIRSVHVKPYQITSTMLEDILKSDFFVRFCFVRSPISRVLSAYLDKIERDEPEGVVFKKNMGLSPDERISFSNFLSLLHANQNSKLTWDPHWRPQFALLRPDLIKYSLIGKFEMFDESYSELNDLLRGKLGPYQTRAPHKTDASSKVRDQVSSADLSLIYDIYKNDFKFFGYGTS